MNKLLAILFTVLLFTAAAFAQERRPVRVNNADDVEELLRDAEDGDRGAQFELSMVYMYKQDSQNQLKWLTASAENGFGKAQYVLGNLYYNGSSKIQKDYEKALHWFCASKESGFGGANVDAKITDSRKQIELYKKQDQLKVAVATEKKQREERAKIAARNAEKETALAIARAATEEIIFANIASQKAAAAVTKTATEKIISAKILPKPEAVPAPEQKSAEPSFLEKIIMKIKTFIKNTVSS